MPDIELGVNDITRMGLEVVGRHDILPIPTEQWIRYEDIEFHANVDKSEFETNDHIIKFKPPDACYIEVMRFRIRLEINLTIGGPLKSAYFRRMLKALPPISSDLHICSHM